MQHLLFVYYKILTVLSLSSFIISKKNYTFFFCFCLKEQKKIYLYLFEDQPTPLAKKLSFVYNKET